MWTRNLRSITTKSPSKKYTFYVRLSLFFLKKKTYDSNENFDCKIRRFKFVSIEPKMNLWRKSRKFHMCEMRIKKKLTIG